MYLQALLLLLSSSLCLCFVVPDQKILGPDPFDAIKKSLETAGIIGDVIDEFNPKCFVAPRYGKNLAIEYGTHVKPSQTKNAPTLEITCPNLQQTPGMTIILTDPDAPSRENPKWSEMCHWIATVPTSKNTDLEFSPISEGDEIVEYRPSGPPEKTGYHRYVFLLLEGDNTNLTKPEDRRHWGFGEKGHGVREWAAKEGLEVVGANFFFAENEKQ